MKATNTCTVVSFVVIVFMVIGVITFHMGCNPDVTTECSTMSFVKAVPYQYTIKPEMCTSGNGNNKKTYKCFTPVVEMDMDHKNQTCHVEIAKGVTSREKAVELAQEYKLGETYSMFHSKEHPEICHKPTNQKTLWIVGVVFLAMSSFCSLRLFAYAYTACRKSGTKIDPNTSVIFQPVADIESCTVSTHVSSRSYLASGRESIRSSIPKAVPMRSYYDVAIAREYSSGGSSMSRNATNSRTNAYKFRPTIAHVTHAELVHSTGEDLIDCESAAVCNGSNAAGSSVVMTAVAVVQTVDEYVQTSDDDEEAEREIAV